MDKFRTTEHKYDNIINLPHHKSNKRKSMPIEERAAQFGAFRALTGYEDEVAEAARITDEKADPFTVESLRDKGMEVYQVGLNDINA